MKEGAAQNSDAAQRMLVLYSGAAKPENLPDGADALSFGDVKGWIRSGKFFRRLRRYDSAELRADSLLAASKPVFAGWLLRLLSRGECSISDKQGARKRLTFPDLLKATANCGRDFARRRSLLQNVARDVASIPVSNVRKPLDLTRTPVYLRTDLWFGITSGGSVGHIAGVANHLDKFCGRPILLTSDAIPTVRPAIETVIIPPAPEFWDFSELPGLNYTQTFYAQATEILKSRQIGFLYQRYGLGNYSGVKLARDFGVPFVLEYNGSDIWINRNWGSGLKYEALSMQIEMLNLRAADLIVVVSRPMRDELIERGVEAEKILVNPNGVDADRYSPQIDGAEIRDKFHLAGKTVIGFIGTFGAWHGAEKLAEAFGLLISENPELRQSARLLLIGDGVKRGEVEAELAKHGVRDEAILTGSVPQADGPKYLAACDILASPHVPNADGTPFFGSPTKLFEYMAMGKGIVASDLNQIGEVLAHQKTAFLVRPGDADDLKSGLKTLIADADLRNLLGAAARCEALANYTWEAHTGKIIAALKEQCA